MTTDPLTTPEKIAFAGDWHANMSWARTAIEYAADQGAEVLVHTGDFGYTFNPRFVTSVSVTAAMWNLPVLFVDGNHENFPWLLRQRVGENGLRQLAPMLWHIPRGFRWTWGGVRFLGLGGAHSVDGIWRRKSGDLWFKEECITTAQAYEVSAAGETDVLISHDCPAGVDIPGLDDDAHLFPQIEIMLANEHQQLLRGVVDAVRPALIWHGHYHRRYTAGPDLGWGRIAVNGLHCDGSSMEENVDVVELDMIDAMVTASRARL